MPYSLVTRIRTCRKAKLPILIWGASGVGKSSMVHQAADGDPVIDLRLSMVEPFDLRGLPGVSKGDVVWARPSWLPSSGRGILFLDEINTAPESVMNAALQLVLDRRCGDHKLGDGWYIVAAGNKTIHNPSVTPIPGPLLNRFVVVECTPTVEDWCTWATASGVHQDVVGFIKFRPDLLHGAATDEYANFPSPRSWERVSQLYATGCTGLDLLEGVVGAGAAAEFLEYVRHFGGMPDVDRIADGTLRHTDVDVPPTTVAEALAAALIMKLRGTGHVDIENCCRVIIAMPCEIAVKSFRQLLQIDDLRGRVMDYVFVKDWVNAKSHLFRRRYL